MREKRAVIPVSIAVIFNVSRRDPTVRVVVVYQAHFRKYAVIKGPGCMRSNHKYQKILPSRVAAMGPADCFSHFVQVCYFASQTYC